MVDKRTGVISKAKQTVKTIPTVVSLKDYWSFLMFTKSCKIVLLSQKLLM